MRTTAKSIGFENVFKFLWEVCPLIVMNRITDKTGCSLTIPISVLMHKIIATNIYFFIIDLWVGLLTYWTVYHLCFLVWEGWMQMFTRQILSIPRFYLKGYCNLDGKKWRPLFKSLQLSSRDWSFLRFFISNVFLLSLCNPF